ncbi:MAG: hypothetical protein AAGE80_05410 [Pseudomonadota bacterium]
MNIPDRTDQGRKALQRLLRIADEVMQAIDKACHLRSAPSETMRYRSMARRALEDAALYGATAVDFAHQNDTRSEEQTNDQSEESPRDKV